MGPHYLHWMCFILHVLLNFIHTQVMAQVTVSKWQWLQYVFMKKHVIAISWSAMCTKQVQMMFMWNFDSPCFSYYGGIKWSYDCLLPKPKKTFISLGKTHYFLLNFLQPRVVNILLCTISNNWIIHPFYSPAMLGSRYSSTAAHTPFRFSRKNAHNDR